MSNDLSIVNAMRDSYDKPDVQRPAQRLRKCLASVHLAGDRENHSLRSPLTVRLSAHATQLPPRAGLPPRCLVHTFSNLLCVHHLGLKPQSQSLSRPHRVMREDHVDTGEDYSSE